MSRKSITWKEPDENHLRIIRKKHPHFRSDSAVISHLLYEEAAKITLEELYPPTIMRKASDGCNYCKNDPPYEPRFEIVVDDFGQEVCPDCSKPLKRGEGDE